VNSDEQTTEERCPACGGELEPDASLRGNDRLHGTPGDVTVRCCRKCGSGVSFPLASAAELPAFYPSAYGPYDDALGAVTGAISRGIRGYQGSRALATAPLRALRGLPPGRAVDVGCGRGDLAGLLVERGWRMTGIEPSPAACRTARARGVDAREGTLGDVTLESGAYDAAIFRHSLEHTDDVPRDLMATVRALRPGGLLLVTVPNFACWQPSGDGPSTSPSAKASAYSRSGASCFSSWCGLTQGAALASITRHLPAKLEAGCASTPISVPVAAAGE